MPRVMHSGQPSQPRALLCSQTKSGPVRILYFCMCGHNEHHLTAKYSVLECVCAFASVNVRGLLECLSIPTCVYVLVESVFVNMQYKM